MSERPTLTARAGWLVSVAEAGNILDRTTLTDFYQPIVGPTAIATLLTLWEQKVAQPSLSHRQSLTTLLVRLNLGLASLRSNLAKLEAVGLIKTFYRQDSQGDCFIFEIQPTLTVSAFLSDPLMSVLLLDALGEQNFQRLVDRSRRYQMDTSKFQDISAKLYDTFHLQADSDAASDAVLQAARRSTKVPSKRESLSDSNFSFPTLMTCLGQAGPSEADIRQQRELIMTEHVLYGIDEPTMAKLILSATDLHNHFDQREFKRVVARAYPRAVTKQTESESDDRGDKQLATEPDTNPETRRSRQEQALEEACRQYSPNDFLVKLKSESGGGYVSPSETKILQRLIDDGKLTAPVINLLSWHVIVDLGHNSLTAGFVDAIANTWIRAGVETIDDALEQIYLFYQHEQRQSQKHRSYRRRPARREARPQWQQDEAAGKKVTKTSAQQEAEVKKLLASLHDDDKD